MKYELRLYQRMFFRSGDRTDWRLIKTKTVRWWWRVRWANFLHNIIPQRQWLLPLCLVGIKLRVRIVP